MSQIIVSPKEQRAFARALAELSREMRSREQALTSKLTSLGSTWQDQHNRRFQRAHEEMALYLKAFHNQAQRYCTYLDQKARAAERYLDV